MIRFHASRQKTITFAASGTEQLTRAGSKSHYLNLNTYSIMGHLNIALILPRFLTSSGSSFKNLLFQSSM